MDMNETANLLERINATTNRLQCKSDTQHIRIDQKNHTIELLHPINPMIYKPSKTGIAFHSCDDRVRVLRGHVGSGKTTMCCAEIVKKSCSMVRCKDGVRRSRWAVIRNTYGDLIKTTIHTWRQWWSDLGEMKVLQTPAFIIRHNFNDGEGPVELELLPIALDTAIDVTKHLKSLEVTGVFLNELSELNRLVLDFFSGGRLPRFPRVLDLPIHLRNQPKPYWAGIISDTNPPEEDSWIYHLFEKVRPPEYTMFVQPPAVIKQGDKYIANPSADNVENIPGGADEYLRMTYGKDENFIRVYLMGEYGTIAAEKRVYNGYNDNIHSSYDKLEVKPEEPLILAADLGTVAPAILVCQFYGNRLYVLKEFCGDFITISELVQNSVMPWIKDICPDIKITKVLHDPADTYDGAEQLRDFFGPMVTPALTNNIEVRIDAVSKMLATLVQGQAQLIVDREGCMQLRKGFNGKYFYRRVQVVNEQKFEDKPYKNHPYSDIHDALQYICCYISREINLAKNESDEYDDYEFNRRRRQANSITGY